MEGRWNLLHLLVKSGKLGNMGGFTPRDRLLAVLHGWQSSSEMAFASFSRGEGA
jgi:hypothetical protein